MPPLLFCVKNGSLQVTESNCARRVKVCSVSPCHSCLPVHLKSVTSVSRRDTFVPGMVQSVVMAALTVHSAHKLFLIETYRYQKEARERFKYMFSQNQVKLDVLQILLKIVRTTSPPYSYSNLSGFLFITHQNR